MIPEGARLLRAHLLRTGQRVPAFCEKHNLSRRIVERVLNAKQHSFTVDFANAMSAATNGEIPPDAWLAATLREASPDEIGRVFPTRQRADHDRVAA